MGLCFLTMGCISPPSSTLTGTAVNPVIEERIREQLTRVEDRKTPDLAEIPSAPPDGLPLREQARQRQAILSRGETLAQEIADERANRPQVSPEERAEALKKAIEQDRAAAAAEGTFEDKVRATQQ